MLRALCMLCLAGLMVGVASSKSEAQVHRGDVRFYIDSGFVNWISERQKGELAGEDVLSLDNAAGVGLFLNGGLGLGYAVTEHIIPGLYLSLQRVKVTSREKVDGDEVADSDGTIRNWELRPNLEIPFNPSSRFVVGGVVGLSLMRRVYDDEGDDSSSFGVGPIGGLAAHGFITNKVSLDLSLLFRATFINDDDREEALEAAGFDDVKFRQLAVLFNVGVSYWL